MAISKKGTETMPDAHAAGKGGTWWHHCTNNTASFQRACVLVPLAFVFLSQRSTVPNVKWRESSSKPWLCLPFCTALPASQLLASSCSWLSSCTARVQGTCRMPQTPWQWRTNRARGRQPILPNVAFKNCRETSFKPRFFLPSARVQGP